MYYAHKGSSNDNAFTERDGMSTRQFLAFKTKAEREAAREQIWADSHHKVNLIDCTRKLVTEYFGHKFIVSKGEVFTDIDAID